MAKSKNTGELKENHPLAKYTSWKIGGAAQLFYQPASIEDLSKFLSFPRKRESSITFLGFGSNVLIHDNGVNGIVIHTKKLNKLIKGRGTARRAPTIYAEAGASLARLPFLHGIPGSVGGALAMNAGAFGEEIWDYVIKIITIDHNGNLNERTPADFRINYRHVITPPNEWFVAAEFISQPKSKYSKKELLAKRATTQPLTEKTCGSVFRNPPGDYAARLIESCGLKGKQIGGAQVSPKHANFIVNNNNATAADIQNLINLIKNEVWQKTGVELVLEVKILS